MNEYSSVRDEVRACTCYHLRCVVTNKVSPLGHTPVWTETYFGVLHALPTIRRYLQETLLDE